MPEPRSSTPLVVAFAVWAAVSSIVLLRLSAEPMQPYGGGSAHYLEHHDRLLVGSALKDLGEAPLARVLTEADTGFPPLVHLVSAAASAVFGWGLHGVLWTGVFWLGLLGLAVGWCASSLSDRPGVGPAAATAVFLTPAVHGFATRYYYDLPMTALLWLTVAAALGTWPRRPVTGTVAVAVAALLSCLAKWAALAFGPGLVLGAALSNRMWSRRTQLLALAGAAAVFAVLMAGTLAVLGPGNSFDASSGEVIRDWAGDDEEAPSLLSGAAWARWVDFADQQLSPPRVRLYAIRIVGSIFGLWLFGLLAWTLVSWWRRTDRAGLPLLVCAVASHGFFLIFVMPVADDRFLLPVVPALLVPAAIGWVHLPRRRRAVAGGLVLGVGLLTAAEFHLGGPSVLGTPLLDDRAGETSDEPASVIRLWGVDDSVEGRGWVHRSRQPSDQGELRERLWQAIRACGADAVATDDEASPVIHPGGVRSWLEYRSRLDELELDRRPMGLSALCEEPPGYEAELALTLPQRFWGEAHPCLPSSEWKPVRTLSFDGRVIQFWGRRTQDVCGDSLRTR